MNIFITLIENVNKSRTSANNLSLKVIGFPGALGLIGKVGRFTVYLPLHDLSF
jgi:hypothetical protein